MAFYKNAQEVVDAGETYENHCDKNGKCSNCGRCCSDLLPMTRDELQRLKDYAKRHHLIEHRERPFFDPNAIDMSCPFRNNETRRCDVYPVRPQICRQFLCSKPKEQSFAARDELHKTRSVYSLRSQVFGNDEIIQYFGRHFFQRSE